MVGKSARKAGDPWFNSRRGHNRFCASVSIFLFSFLHPASEFLMKLPDAVHW